MSFTPVARLRRRRAARRGRGRRHAGAGRGRSRSPPRPSATPPSTRPRPSVIAELAGTAEAPGEFAGREKEIKEAVRVAHQEARAQARSSTRASASTAAARRDLRPLSAEVGVLPTAHGSGLFQRGETQVLNVTTLGMPRMDQMLDTLGAGHQQALHAPLQHAAVGQRRDRPRRLAQAPRDRPRRARRAGPAARRAQPGGVRLHAARSCPRCCRRTAPPRWRRCAPRRCR